MSRLKPPRTTQPLPRYVRRKRLADLQLAYFFEPPTWARKDGCPVAAEWLIAFRRHIKTLVIENQLHQAEKKQG